MCKKNGIFFGGVQVPQYQALANDEDPRITLITRIKMRELLGRQRGGFKLLQGASGCFAQGVITRIAGHSTQCGYGSLGGGTKIAENTHGSR